MIDTERYDQAKHDIARLKRRMALPLSESERRYVERQLRAARCRLIRASALRLAEEVENEREVVEA